MSLATRNPLPPLLPDTIMQVPRKSEQNFSVSCLNCLPLTLCVENCQIRDSGSGLLANSENVLITNSTFVIVSLPRGLYNQLIIVHILSARTIFHLPIRT